MESPLNWNEIGKIPYLAKGEFSYRELRFPELSQEWKEKVHPWYSVKDRSHRCPQQLEFVSAFLQAWLFFGLLKEIIGEEHWNRESLIKDGNEINKAAVIGLLEQWWRRGLEENGSRRASQLVRVQLVLSEARNHVLQICSVENINDAVENEQYNRIALSLMVLGEMLSSHTTRLIDETGHKKALGWYIDGSRGWGQTGTILRDMQKQWRPETVHILRGSLQGHATAQLYALRMASMEPDQGNDGGAERENEEGQYSMAHSEGCDYHHEGNKEDELVGEDETRLADIIRRGKIPLVKYSQLAKTVQVVEYEVGMRYAILSHVWSDGYGNPNGNRIHRCLLDLFNKLFFKAQKLLHRINPDPELPFWMDTLTIPVNDMIQRKEAIKTMHRCYTNADFTVVLDSQLSKTRAGTTYTETAMKIFASRWMSRLWTLQEAYLSKKVVFRFVDDELVDLDMLEGNYLSNTSLAESMVAPKARKYYDRLLGWQRQKRIYNVRVVDESLLPFVWEAVQWRTTSHPKHETQALMTLFQLEIDFPETFDHGHCGNSCGKKLHGPCRDDLDNRMKLLLEALYEAYPGSIPQGIIFLPGRRLPIESFGWAPCTWMIGQNVRHNDPIFNISTPAELTFNGLLVRYPGFVLHSSENRMYVESNNIFVFPRDILLLEWLSVRPVDGFCDALPTASGSELAIISSRETIVEDHEIALLVEIKKRRHPKLHVEILSRVEIWRERDQVAIQGFQRRFWEHKKDTCEYGESLGPGQLWCIGQHNWGLSI